MKELLYEYIKSRLKYKNMGMNVLCEGIIDEEKLYKYINQQLSLSKLVRDRLLDRAGGSDYDYECYLMPDEYSMWEERQKIVRTVMAGDIIDVMGIYSKYKGKDESDGRLTLQFEIFMQLQCKKNEAVHNIKPDNNVLFLYENVYCDKGFKDRLVECIRITVTHFDELVINIKKELKLKNIYTFNWDEVYVPCIGLGRHEIALILDYAMCMADGELEECIVLCHSMIKYIVTRFSEKDAMTSVYPKAVCCLCSAYERLFRLEDNKIKNRMDKIYAELLELCNNAINMLGLSLRTYYIWELLHLRKKYLEITYKEKLNVRDQSESLSVENDALINAFQYIFEFTGISKENINDAYLYIETEVYDVTRIIDVRRKMMKLTQKELCTDLCTEATLIDIIKKRRNPHRQTVRLILERLNMGNQLERSDIISPFYEDRMKARELKKASANRNFEYVTELVEILKGELDMSEPDNRRFIGNHYANYKLCSGIIDEAEYIAEMKTKLEETVDTNAIFECNGENNHRNIFLTGSELLCLYNIVKIEEKRENLDLLRDICYNYEENFGEVLGDNISNHERVNHHGMHNHVNRYGLIMDEVSSGYGNIGEFELSDIISRRLMEDTLRLYRTNQITDSIYNLWWNRCEQKGYIADNAEGRRELSVCIALSKWMNNTNDYIFYCKKYNKFYS